MSRKLRVGVISANWGMRAHLPAWHAQESVEVMAVCTSRQETAEEARETYGLDRCYWDYRAMCADPDLDIIDVGTRPDLRRDMVMTAIENGKHVFASAPFGANVDAAREMTQAAEAAGIVGVIDSTLSRAPAHRQMKALLAQGWAGTPVAVTAQFAIPLFNAATAPGSGWRWFGTRRHGASAMRNLGTHTLHLLVELFGQVRSVSAMERTALKEWTFADGESIRPETADTALLQLEFENGIAANVAVSYASPALTGWRMDVTGSEGTLISRHEDYFPSGPDVELLGARSGQRPEPIPLPDEVVSPQEFSFTEPPVVPQAFDIAGVMASMIGAIRNGDTPVPDFTQGLHVEKILDAAARSADSGQTVKVNS